MVALFQADDENPKKIPGMTFHHGGGTRCPNPGDHNGRPFSGQCWRAYCLIYECYPDGAIDGDDLTSTDRLSLAAFQAGLTAGAVGGSGPS